MNPLTWSLILIPTVILIYRIGGARGRMLISHYEHQQQALDRELDHVNAMYEDIVDEWSNACLVLHQVNRKLADCLCGQRLNQQQEALVMSVLIEASIIDPFKDDE